MKSQKSDGGKRRRTKGLRHLPTSKNPTSTGGHQIFRNVKSTTAPFSAFLQLYPQCTFAKKARFSKIPVLQKYNGGKPHDYRVCGTCAAEEIQHPRGPLSFLKRTKNIYPDFRHFCNHPKKRRDGDLSASTSRCPGAGAPDQHARRPAAGRCSAPLHIASVRSPAAPPAPIRSKPPAGCNQIRKHFRICPLMRCPHPAVHGAFRYAHIQGAASGRGSSCHPS